MLGLPPTLPPLGGAGRKPRPRVPLSCLPPARPVQWRDVVAFCRQEGIVVEVRCTACWAVAPGTCVRAELAMAALARQAAGRALATWPMPAPCCRLAQAYSPLAKAQKLADPMVGAIAQRLGATPAQVLIRWVPRRQGQSQGVRHRLPSPLTCPAAAAPHAGGAFRRGLWLW